MIPWLIFGLVIVPLLVVAFVASRRRTRSFEHPAGGDTEDKAELEQEFAAAEAYQEQWRAADKARHDQELLP